jgi:Plasmid encoded RepA protein
VAEIHSLIRNHGWEATREMLPTRRALVDIASNILSEESDSFGITYSGFCLTALPHRKIPDDAVWQRHGHRLTLVIDPGSLRIGGKLRTFGVPYGSRARMILLYLQTRAVQAQCPEIELGRSMNEWLDRMGLSTGGKTYNDIREQANRISACNLTFYWDDNHAENFEKDNIVKGGIQLRGSNTQGSLWLDTVRLSDTFFRALQAHPVPIWEPALRAISNKSMAIDIYVWLAYRLHSLTKPMPVSWNAMHEQFGAGFESIRSFRQSFKKSLEFALAVYPDAKVDVTDKGLILYSSRSPIEPRGVTTRRCM